jgi:two-component system, chemotaxis family, chemotaxis protein CheY
MARILVVDDSPAIRKVLFTLLKRSGFEVDEATNGELALQKAKNSKIDLVVSDVNMPKMDGLEFLAKLRELDGYRKVPVVMLTTESQKEQVMEAKQHDIRGWVLKPLDPEKFLHTINNLLP